MKILLKIFLNLLLITEKKVLLIFLIQSDNYLLHEVDFSERDINRSNKKFKNILKEQHEE